MFSNNNTNVETGVYYASQILLLETNWLFYPVLTNTTKVAFLICSKPVRLVPSFLSLFFFFLLVQGKIVKYSFFQCGFSSSYIYYRKRKANKFDKKTYDYYWYSFGYKSYIVWSVLFVNIIISLLYFSMILTIFVISSSLLQLCCVCRREVVVWH